MLNATIPGEALFSREQANAMLPLLRLIVADISLAHRELTTRRMELHRLLRRRDGKSTALHGDELEESRADIQTEARQLEEYIKELERLGVRLISAEDGIVDLPTVLEGKPAFFVWRLGDKEIGFWHRPNEPSSERHPL
jgi:hypothetical protein